MTQLSHGRSLNEKAAKAIEVATHLLGFAGGLPAQLHDMEDPRGAIGTANGGRIGRANSGPGSGADPGRVLGNSASRRETDPTS